MLNTLHDGPFTQMKEQGDIHVHHYSKGENPDDKKKKEKEAKANGNGNGDANGAPKEEEQQAPPPPEDPGNPMAKFSKDEVERIRSILKKEKEEKEKETKLDKKSEKVNTKPKMKDTKISENMKNKEGHSFVISDRDVKGKNQDKVRMHVQDKSGKKIKDWGSHVSVDKAKNFAKARGFSETFDANKMKELAKKDNFIAMAMKKDKPETVFNTHVRGDRAMTKKYMGEMSADLAYRAMDKADKKSRGEMSVMDPKRARKKAQQARKFADYSIKKTLSKEEFDHAHNQALEENAKRDLMAFGAKLKGYSDRSGGIDKSYFENIAKKAMAGIMPGAKDIEGDTDPRDFVLDMMNRTFPKQIMKQYKGLSPSFDNYLNMNYDIHDEAYDMKIPPYANRKTAQAEKKAREEAQRKRAGLDEVIKKSWKKGTYHVKDADGKIHGTYKSGSHASKAMHKLMDKGDHKELEVSRANEELELDEVRKSDYQLYHKDFSSAMQHAYAVAKKRGYTVDPQEIDNKVATGPRKPSSGKTNRYILGTDKKQNLHVQVANLDNKRYELNMYIEEVIPEETKMIPTNEKKLDPVGQEDGDVDNDGDKDSSDNYLMKRRNAIKKAMGKRKTGMKEEHQLNTMSDGAFTSADMLAQTYLSMSRDEQIQVTEVTNEDLNEENIDEVESAYAKQIADYKAKGGTVKKYTGPDMKKVKKATSGFKQKLAKTMKIHSDQDEKEKAEKEANKQQDEGHSMPMDKGSVAKRVSMFKKLRDKKASQGYQKTGLANEAYGDYNDDRAMAAQKAQMPGSLGGKHKDKSRPTYTTQVTKQKSQYHAKEETEVNEISDRKIQKAIDKGRRIHGYAHDPKLGMGKADKAYGDKKKKQADRMDDKLSDRRDNRELKRHGRFLEPGEQGYSKARDDLGHKYRAREMKKEESEVNEISDRLAKRAINKAHAASQSALSRGDKKLSRKRANQRDNMTDMLADKQDRREYENPGKGKYRRDTVAQMGRHYEEVSKNVSKLNKIQENRRLERNKVVADGQGGAGEVGTDELTKNYQQNTPGQPNELIRESSVVVNSQDMFKRFEDMVSYMMGISVTHPESFQMFPIGESGRMRLEYEHGPLATICETDVINFFGPNVDMEQFVEMVKEFGVNVTTAENSFVVGDSEGTEGTVKEITPGQYAEEYSKKYTTGGMMDQMRANIEELAKRI